MKIYGVSSHVPQNPSFHYLFCDVDSILPVETERWFKKHCPKYNKIRSPRGHHFIVLEEYPFASLVQLLPQIPGIDLAWFRIGVQRGYWFLASWMGTLYSQTKSLSFMELDVKDESNEWYTTKLQNGLTKRLVEDRFHQKNTIVRLV